MILGILYFKNPKWAWYLVIGEILLGGSGHYLELFGLSIRTVLIGFFMFLWLSNLIGNQNLKKTLNFHGPLTIIISLLFLILFFAIGNGIYNGHEFRNVIGDFIPFTFFLLLFPSYYFFKDTKSQEYLVRLLTVFIVGTAIFSAVTFGLFSSGISEIHQPFYKWYRDIDVGKITDMQTGFFRIVETTHLIIIPLILLISSLLMRKEKHNKMWYIMLGLLAFILITNLSRGYFLALAIGLLILKYKHKWLPWLKVCAILTVMIIMIFSGTNWLASGGKTLGWELFGLRVKSFTSPEIEISTETRMLKLPIILNSIKDNPLLGTGLGAQLSFLNTATNETEKSGHFDWGYLEMWVEIGLLGLIILTGLYILAIYELIRKIKNIPDWHDFDVGLIAGLVAFLIMNITIAALFHVFGLLFLVFALTIAIKHTSIFDRTTTVLYQVFNRLSS